MFVRNLANSVTEEILETAFGQFGKLERVKKLKDYAFIHYDERDGAVKVRLFGTSVQEQVSGVVERSLQWCDGVDVCRRWQK